MSVEQYFSIICDTLVGLSAIVVAVVAIIGLKTWRRELKGRVLFDIARKIIRLSIELRANFEWARFPLSTSNENSGRQKAVGESDGEAQARDAWYVRWNRLKPIMANIQTLQEMDWEIQTLLGDKSQKISTAIKIYRESYANLKTAIDEYFEIKVEASIKESQYNNHDYLTELSHIVYGTSTDDFSKKIYSTHEQLAGELKAFIK